MPKKSRKERRSSAKSPRWFKTLFRDYDRLAYRDSRRSIARLELLEPRLPLAANFIINEFMASNDTGLVDQDGDHSDWIEIRNNGDATGSLNNYFLTDDALDLAKWRIPNVSLPANGYLVIFASAKDRAVAGQQLHTNFSLAADGEYLGLVRPDGTTVASHFSPAFPPQQPDYSYGFGSANTNTVLLTRGATAKVKIPADNSLQSSWFTSGYTPDGTWTTGPTGVGFEPLVTGFAVRKYRANLANLPGGIDSLEDADLVISDPTKQAQVNTENRGTINYNDASGSANTHYTNSATFPGGNADDFAILATAQFTLTAGQAGNWTFGVRSDDGFRLLIDNDHQISFNGLRGPADNLGTFNLAAGTHTIHLVMYDHEGASEVELFAAQGTFATWNSANFRLVGNTGGGGLAVQGENMANGANGFRSQISTDVQSNMHNVRSTAYVRIPFTVNDLAAVDALTLRMKYDDGFVAYINGQEVTRRNAPGAAGTLMSFDAVASPGHIDSASLVYEDIDISSFVSSLVVGSGNVLAIHGLNTSAANSNFLILPELIGVDIVNAGELYFATPTPGANNSNGINGFVADTTFDHDRGFYSSAFNLAISTATPGATIRYTLDGSTPTESNGTIYTGPISIPGTRTVRAVAYKTGLVTTNVDTVTFLFTSDIKLQAANGQPPAGWPSSWGSNVVDYGMDPDIVNNATWGPQIEGALKALPSMSIVTPLANLFDPSTGIYANPGQDGVQWERGVSIEYILPPNAEDPGGVDAFQIDAGLRIRGGFSRSTSNPKHSFRVLFKSEYGAGKLNYPIYGDEGAEEFDGFDLRTAQNYSWAFGGDSSMVFTQDAVARYQQAAMGQQYTRGEFIHLYINGLYWGLYEIEERPEASYGETYYGGDKDNYDVIKADSQAHNTYATDGDMVAWTDFWTLSNQMRTIVGATAAETQQLRFNHYMKLQGLNPDGTRNTAFKVYLDPANVADMMLVIFWGGNWDGPAAGSGNYTNNWFGMRDRTGEQGWQFFVHDSEHTLRNINENRVGPYAAGSNLNISNPQWIHQMMMYCDEYRLLFADRAQQAMFNGGPMTSSGATAMFQGFNNQIATAIIAESARWGDSKVATPKNKNDWLSATGNVIGSFMPSRTSVVINQLNAATLYNPTSGFDTGVKPLLSAVSAPNLNQVGGPFNPGFQLTMSGSGVVYYTIDGSDPRRGTTNGGVVGPTALTYSTPLPLNASTRIRARVFNGSEWSAEIDATFILNTPPTLRITELHYNPPDAGGFSGSDLEFVELVNTGGSSINLQGMRLATAIDYTFGNVDLAAGQRIVVAKNLTAFTAVYGSGINVVGNYSGQLSNQGEQLTLYGVFNEILQQFTYETSGAWPGRADGDGSSLEVISTTGDYNDPSNWRSSAEVGGTPGTAGTGPGVGVVINEVLTHTDLPQADSIELYNQTDAAIDISGWFLSDSKDNYQKYRIPDGTILPAQGYIVFDQFDFDPTFDDAVPNPGPNDFSFDGQHGEEAYLTAATPAGVLTKFIDEVDFGGARNGQSFGRWPDTTGKLHAMTNLTLGAANSGPAIGPIVISEVMYNPSNGNDDFEFIEILNRSASPVNLFSQHTGVPGFLPWKIEGGVDFTFPVNAGGGITMAPGAIIVLVHFNPTDTVKLNAFRNAFNISPSVTIMGPYTGVLDNGGEGLRVVEPGDPPADEPTFFPSWIIDKVVYDDDPPWPTNTDGGGFSLHRVGAGVFAGEVTGWQSGVPRPGTYDLSIPTAVINPVTPDPRSTFVNAITITFSEPVFGFNLADLGLFRNGIGGSLLTGSQTLTTSNNITWTLGNLIGITGQAGSYQLKLTAAGSGIIDSAQNPLAQDATESWVTETTRPTVDIIDVTPDPRGGGVNSIDIVFSEAVTGFNLSDLSLTLGSGGNLLTGSQTLTTSDNVSWTLGNLSGLTAASGSYTLFLLASSSGITDFPGNDLLGSVGDTFVVDATPPTADVDDVSPDPRTSSVNQINLTFSEAVFGLDLADLELTRDGGANLLTGAQFLFTSDNITWTLSGLASLTGISGSYLLLLTAPGSEVVDALGNPLTVSASDAFTVDNSPPTADIVDVTPDPSTSGPGSITITFSEAVTGFDLADLALTLGGGANLLTGGETLNTADNITWTLGGLSGITSTLGTYTLLLTAAGSGIIDGLSNALASNASDSFTVITTAPHIKGEFIFYNKSFFDGSTVSIPDGTNDNGAIATDKTAYHAGQGAATFANYTSYTKGINGIMVDIGNRPGVTPEVSHFTFMMGNNNDPNTWVTAPAPVSITLEAGGGVDGSDRIKLIWNDGDILKTWLQVTIGTDVSGLATPHVFYFGNAVGEGNSTAGVNAVVGIADEIAARNNPKGLGNFATVTDLYDYDRNRQVNVADQITARNNTTSISTHLKLINIAGSGGGHGEAGGGGSGSGDALQPAALTAAGGSPVASDSEAEVVPPTTIVAIANLISAVAAGDEEAEPLRCWHMPPPAVDAVLEAAPETGLGRSAADDLAENAALAWGSPG